MSYEYVSGVGATEIAVAQDSQTFIPGTWISKRLGNGKPFVVSRTFSTRVGDSMYPKQRRRTIPTLYARDIGGKGPLMPLGDVDVSTRGVWGPGLYSWGMPYQTYKSQIPSRYVPALGTNGETSLAPPGTEFVAETASGAAAMGAGIMVGLALNFAEGALAGGLAGRPGMRKEAAVWGGLAAALTSPLAMVFRPWGVFGIILNTIRPFAIGALAGRWKASRQLAGSRSTGEATLPGFSR